VTAPEIGRGGGEGGDPISFGHLRAGKSAVHWREGGRGWGLSGERKLLRFEERFERGESYGKAVLARGLPS